MHKYVVLGAAIAGLMLTTSAEARRRHHGGAQCRLGQMYRPSLGICESRSAHRQTMRAASRFEEKSRRELRRMSRRERREYRREMREAARQEREEAPRNRVLARGPVIHVETEADTQAAEAAMEAPKTTPIVVARPRATQDDFSGIPWTFAGPFSLNPLPRYASRVDTNWRH